MSEKLLEIKNLSASFTIDRNPVRVLTDISYDVNKGEILGIVGESGSGKSVTAKWVLQLIPTPPGKVIEGEILYKGQDILKLNRKQMCHLRGAQISMIFQEPMTSLNPVYTCGEQIMEALMLHKKMTKSEARAEAIKMLSLVGIPMPEQRVDAYPHQLSGGMRQRVMIAMAISCNPELLIADEPTTALDPTIQAQVLELIKDLQKKTNMSVMYITHDLGVVAELCDRVVVMYGGMVMEVASVRDLFHNVQHPYTLGLLKAMPVMNKKIERLYNIKGSVPHLRDMPEGCHFCPRCPYATEECEKNIPDMVDVGNGHKVRCFHPQNHHQIAE